MAIRMSGIVSGLDTESIIKELMEAQSMKKTKIENKITKFEWKQEKWKTLNTKIYALYTGSLSKFKTQGNYLTKKASSSNENKVTVSADVNAVEGTHTVKVNQLASAQYVTGAKLGNYTDADGESKAVATTTKLTELGMSVGTVVSLKAGDKEAELTVDAFSTVDDFLKTCTSAGLNASLDTTSGRIYVSSKDSGIENAFSMTSGTSSSTAAREAVKTAIGYADTAYKSKVNTALDAYKSAVEAGDADAKTKAMEDLSDLAVDIVTEQVKKETEETYRAGLDSESAFSKDALDALIETALAEAELPGGRMEQAVTALGGALGNYEAAVQSETTTSGSELEKLGLGNVSYTTDTATGAISYTSDGLLSLAEAADSEIVYNGATMTGASNNYSINGLKFTLVNKTEGDEVVSMSVSKDTDAVYDMIKTFFKDYNELLGEMNDLYYADSARDYDVLTDEERDSMTDEQIEKWETKIKDSLLRRDSTLNGVLSAMKQTMAGSIEVNGKSYSLSFFGISTVDYTEKGQYHIYGNVDDNLVADQTDKLRKALESDPDTVMQVLSGLASNLYDTMTDKMKATTLSSAMTFYNNKQMDNTLDDYKEELEKMEDRLQEMEDRYYDQFTAMEVAMSKLNSQQSTLASYLGTPAS